MEQYFIWAQIAGCIAFIFSIWRLQFKNPRHIALGEVPTAAMWSIQYYLLNAQGGLIINLLCIVRGALIYSVPDRFLKHVIGAFLIIVTVLIFKNSVSYFDFFALAGVYIYATACLFRDNRPVMARLILLHSIPWLVYNCLVFSYFGVLSSSLGMASCIIGMARHENWMIGRCYRSFIPSVIFPIFVTSKWRTNP